MTRPRFSGGEQVRVAQLFNRKDKYRCSKPTIGERCLVKFKFMDKYGVNRYEATFEDGSITRSAAEHRLMSEDEWQLLQNLKGI
jgi:hypothetical protein